MIDITEHDEAVDLALKLRAYCVKHNFPVNTQIAGVLVFGDRMKDKMREEVLSEYTEALSRLSSKIYPHIQD